MYSNSDAAVSIVIIVIALLVFLFVILLGHASHCSRCKSQLSTNRQIQYYLKAKDGMEKEVCKSCYRKGGSIATLNTRTVNPPLENKGTYCDVCGKKIRKILYSHVGYTSKVVCGINCKKAAKIKFNRPIFISENSLCNKDGASNLSKDIDSMADVNFKEKVSAYSTPSSLKTSTLKSPRSFEFRVQKSIKETRKLRGLKHSNLLFLGTETNDLDDPQMIALAIFDIDCKVIINIKVRYEGNISESSSALHEVSKSKGDISFYLDKARDQIIHALRGRTIVGYNIDYDINALINTFNDRECKDFFEQIRKNSFCLMKAYTEIFRRYKTPSLVEACQLHDIDILTPHVAEHDAKMVLLLFKEIMSSPDLYNDWLAGFEDINWKNLCQKSGTRLSLWSSKDKMREILYAPESAGGSHKVAELTKELKINLKDKEPYFKVVYFNGHPDIEISYLNSCEYMENLKLYSLAYQEQVLFELKNAKLPRGNSLQGTLTLDCKEANSKRDIKSNKSLYMPDFSVGDVIFIPELSFSNDINLTKIPFLDKKGLSYGSIQNITKFWTRVFGLVMKGYKAEVHILSIRPTKVKVKFMH